MSSMDKNFLGMEPIFWFGVVENRQDPLELGRVQVRIFGWHSASLVDIPSENLPWAQVSHSINNRSFATSREDDLVFGIFLDGRSAQFPLVLGLIPGFFSDPANVGLGFHDLRTQAILRLSPKRPVGREYNTDGSGIQIHEANTADTAVLETIRHPQPDEFQKSSISGVATYQNLANTVIQARKNNLDKNILSAQGLTWSEPYPAYNPLYPYNQATETESGHVFELDDTPGSERVHMAHRSGSYYEYFPTGTKVEKITKSNYSIVMADDYLHVMGKVIITVESDAHIKVNGTTYLEAGNDLSVNVAGDMDVSVGGDFNVSATNLNLAAKTDITLISDTQHLTASTSLDATSEATKITATGELDLSGSSANFSAPTMSVGTISMISGVTAISGSTIQNKVMDPQGGFGTIMPSGGVSTASQAASGTSKGLPGAISATQKNSGEADPETVPVPLSSKVPFDPATGTAYNQAQFLVPGANNGTQTPDSTPIPTLPCSFDPSTHTFLQDKTTWNVSPAGLALIQKFEGFAKVVSTDKVTAYPDPATGGEPLTIGYGSTSVAIDQPVTLGELISRATAEQYLIYAINKKFMPTIRQGITVPITQNMLDAIVSFVYNVGPGNFLKSTFRSRINAQQWCAAGDAILVWNKAAGKVLPGLTQRRNAERNLFIS